MAVLVFGAGGGLGQALVQELLTAGVTDQVIAITRQPKSAATSGAGIEHHQVADYSEASLQVVLKDIDKPVTGVLSTVGVLHTNDYMPEKRLAEVTANQLAENFAVNATLPLLLMQQSLPLMDRKAPGFWVQLSAMVGSATNNYLGGWYSYRASKAALNMLLKTASIELRRTHKKLTVAAIHPGTTDTQLSAPFQERISDGKLYTPAESAERIVQVIQNLNPDNSGKLWHWNGEELRY
ncbi:MAG: SDR family NAD(P)-dependent oxidoreductase [Idiomarina sp.]